MKCSSRHLYYRHNIACHSDSCVYAMIISWLLVIDTFVIKPSLKKINDSCSRKNTEAQTMSAFSASLGERDAGSGEMLF